MNMFNSKSNDGFYELGLAVVRGIAERIEEEGVAANGKDTGDRFDLEGHTDDEKAQEVQEAGAWRQEKDAQGRDVLVEM